LRGPNYLIPDTVGQIRGPNLFHSFDQFNLIRGESATFTGPNTIANIIGRVTGGSPSSIDGTIRSQMAGANLYLLNPSGVLFGPNASLDVSGSFHVSTADYLRLADGARFFARLSETSTLSVAPPAAFGFLGPTPAAIAVQGSTLQVPEGATFSVVGGETQIVGGTLRAPSGRMQIASMAAAGEVHLVTPGQAPDLQVDSFAHLGRIALSQNALVDASGNGGGTVLIRGGRLLVDHAFMSADNQGTRDGTGLGVDLGITADAVLTNGARITADSVRAGRARDLRLTAGSVHLEQGAQLSSSTAGPGQGGTVRVTATDTLTLTGTASSILATASGIFAAAFGTGAGAGNAGSVVVEAPRVTLTGGAQIASNTGGLGQGGTVRVTATDTLTLDGTSPVSPTPSSIIATAFGTGTGAGSAGSVVVEAPRVALTGGAQIASSTSGPGQGGTVTVTAAETLTITGHTSGLRTTAAGSGQGGDLTVDAHQVQLTDGAVITAESTGAGNAGSLTLTARDSVLLRGHSAVTTAASQATGGNIRVTALALVRLQDSQLSATVGGGAGDGGNVTIDPAFIVLQGSQITANAFAGAGGRISLTASKAFLADPSSVITASSTLGINGQVAIQAPVTSISGAVAPLPQAFAQTTELLRSRCVERLREETVSRFVVRGRDGVPLEPGSLLLSPLVGGEQPDPAPLTDVHVGGLERHNPGYLYLRGTHAQARWPGALDVECTKWMGQ
jgi:filamentous hemagglutinin family protein